MKSGGSGTAGEPSHMQKMMELLEPAQRRAAAGMLGLMFIGMVLETLGIGLVVPAIIFMTNANLAASGGWMATLLDVLGHPTRAQLVVGGMVGLVALHTVRVLFVAFLSWRQARFAFDLQASLSMRLFAGYLRQPYTFHLQRNSAQLIRNTINQVAEVTGVVQYGLILATEGLVLAGTTVLLFVAEPVGAAVVVVTFGLASWAFVKVTRRRLARWGEARQVHEGLRIQHLQQGLGGAKDVKLLGREGDFLDRYEEHNFGSARIAERQAVLQALPRLWMELLAVVELAVLVVVMVVRGRDMSAVLPTIVLFGAAAFRLMPSASRILGAIQIVRFGTAVIDSIHAEVQLFGPVAPATSATPLPVRRSIETHDVRFTYPGSEQPVLHGISLSIPRGTSVGFIGGSGAGKSTMIDLLLGLLTPTSGRITVDGTDIQSNTRGWQDQIGYVPQTIYLTDDSLRRNVAFGYSDDQIDDAAVHRALAAAQLEGFVASLPQGLDTVVGERGVRLSGGQRQRIGIARALYHDPDVLVLDEATSSVDTVTERGIMESVEALHGTKTIVIVAHRLTTVEHCDQVFQFDHGRIVNVGAGRSLQGT